MDQSSPQGQSPYGGNPSVFNNPGGQQNLPNATATLVLGIISILGCMCYGVVGLICGIIALVLSNKDLARYRSNPHTWTTSSYNNLKAGRICAIIGIVLSALYLVAVVIMIATFGVAALSDPDMMRQMMENR